MDKFVGYEHREHTTVVRLEPGEEKLFRLPPITPGQVIVAAPDQVPAEPHWSPRRPPRPPRDDLEIQLTHPGGVSETGSIGATAHSLDRRPVACPGQGQAPCRSGGRDVRLVANYNSVLPILERRVPADFYHGGFASNYNEQQYLQVTLDDNYIEIGFREDFRLLYGLEGKKIFSAHVHFRGRLEMKGPVFGYGEFLR